MRKQRFGLGAPARSLDRRTAVRGEVPRYLIVCEGEKTEKHYFEGFRVPKDVVRVVGAGANTVSVVDKAIELRGEGDYDQVWCVFDRDSFKAERFKRALELARREELRVAYSNEAFEVWFLLHFKFCDAALSRTTYRQRLTKCLGRAYEKNDPHLFDALVDKQDTAIRNAKKLLERFHPPNPEADNPSTTVHLLVEELRQHEVQRRTS